MIRKFLLNITWKLQSKITPGLKYSQTIYEEVLNEHCNENFKWLDLGCGHSILPAWRLEQEKVLTSKVKHIVGLDYDHLSLKKHKTIKNRLRGDISKLPFKDNSFDLITSNMVFEHLENPENQIKEISRILSCGGKLIFHTPNKFGYATLMARVIPEVIKGKLIYFLERRKEEDVFPAFYRINSQSEIRKATELSGLKITKLKFICSSAQLFMLPPIVIIELIWIRFLMSKTGRSLRPNIIVIMEKR